MKSKSVLFAIILFAALNTSFLWERLPSGCDFFLTMIFGFIGLILVFAFLLKLGGLFIDKFKNRNNIVSVIIVGTVLLFCYMFPLGLIRGSDFDPDHYLIASRKDAVNCQTTIILGMDKTFIERQVCFGVDRKSGTYEIINDTVFLSFNDKSNFGMEEAVGIIEWKDNGKDGDYGSLNYFQTGAEEKPMNLIITRLKKKQHESSTTPIK